MSYRLKDGRVSAFYGDTDVVLQVFEKNATEVQFKKNETDTWDISLANNEVTIPNEFFNGTYSRVNFYITDGTYTISRGEIEINPRVLPTDYIENPTRVKTYSDILKIMEEYKASATEGVAEITSLKETIDATVDDVSDKLDKALLNTEAVEKAVTATESAQKQAEADAEQVAEDKTEVSQMKTDVTAIRDSLSSLETTVQGLADKAETSATEAQTAADNAKTSENTVSGYMQSISDAEARIDKKATEVADLAARKGDKGDKGDTGDAGVGIRSITTSESTFDGGNNIITINLTDGNSKQFAVKNGEKGDKGDTGTSISEVATELSDADGGANTITFTFSDDTVKEFTVKNGTKGSQGIQGIKGDKGETGLGISSIATNEVSADEGANTVTITLTDNTSKTFTVKNGSKGSKGDKGDTPVRGTDYWTESDKTEIVNSVLAQIENFSTEAF